MSKESVTEEQKNQIQKTRDILKAKEEELKKQEEIKALEDTLNQTVLGFCKNPDKTSKDYMLIKLKFNIETQEAIVVDAVPITNRVAGKSFEIEQDNLQLMFNKLKKRGKK